MHDSGSDDPDEADEGSWIAPVVSDFIFKKPGRPENETPTELLERVAREVREVCQHSLVQPSFDGEAARGLDEYEVRRRWPRFMGECPTCHAQVILYASCEHYISGDW